MEGVLSLPADWFLLQEPAIARFEPLINTQEKFYGSMIYQRPEGLHQQLMK
jgi:hypothetical protein